MSYLKLLHVSHYRKQNGPSPLINIGLNNLKSPRNMTRGTGEIQSFILRNVLALRNALNNVKKVRDADVSREYLDG
jgi:hypothetical protein